MSVAYFILNVVPDSSADSISGELAVRHEEGEQHRQYEMAKAAHVSRHRENHLGLCVHRPPEVIAFAPEALLCLAFRAYCRPLRHQQLMALPQRAFTVLCLQLLILAALILI